LRFLRSSRKATLFVIFGNKMACAQTIVAQNRNLPSPSVEAFTMSTKPKTKQSHANPHDHRRFAADRVRQCLAIPRHLRRSKVVQLMMAKAWHKLADQAEELRNQHPPSAAT
jgi:hypothetical protein